MNDCLFCKIINKELPTHIIYEDKDSVAFLDIKPHSKGHTVVIPKKHAVTPFDLDPKSFQELLLDVKKVMEKLRDVLYPDGFNVGWNQNTAAGQVVAHLHIHIFPRYNGDGGGSMHSIINNPGRLSVDDVAKLFKK